MPTQTSIESGGGLSKYATVCFAAIFVLAARMSARRRFITNPTNYYKHLAANDFGTADRTTCSIGAPVPSTETTDHMSPLMFMLHQNLLTTFYHERFKVSRQIHAAI